MQTLVAGLSLQTEALLLREVEQWTSILQRFVQYFTDYRDEKRIEHHVLTLVSQRVIGLALGYEDLNCLASDKMLAIVVGKTDPLWIESLQRIRADLSPVRAD